MLYRRFGFLQARLLLNKQDQLRALEEQLDEMDRGDDEEYLKSRELDDADDRPRTKLLKKIEVKFREYGMCIDIETLQRNLINPSRTSYHRTGLDFPQQTRCARL
jgi:hypothetical protein